MGTKIEYVDTTHLYATKYIRNSKAIAVLWAIFTICYAIIGIVAFVTPEWIGDPDNESAGRLGLWQVCQRDEIFDNCKRRWETILTVPTFSFQLATFFMVAAVALALLTICFLIFLIFMKSTRVFHICGWMQIISALCMIVACAAFPFGWNSDDFRKICGPDANRFELGLCGIRWAYPLAIIGCRRWCGLGDTCIHIGHTSCASTTRSALSEFTVQRRCQLGRFAEITESAADSVGGAAAQYAHQWR
ncbi:unnamed protein product [Ceratitis capitata]|uniref:(Mediterranean fruit fly) hypothetical protein n=2 Tax=Ceratitis capitata TaxID=7213 RepID=A0A811UTW9_CERCA|nr:unnamed protein product [Ceratitis capitata]